MNDCKFRALLIFFPFEEVYLFTEFKNFKLFFIFTLLRGFPFFLPKFSLCLGDG